MQLLAVRPVRTPLDSADAELPLDAPVVLFVTDDEDLRAVAPRALRRLGFQVVTAGHGGHAVLAALTSSRIDVLVTELAMRDTTGPELAQRLRRYRADLPAVFLANAGTREAEGLVVRPFTRDDLVRELDLALATARS